jgi:hypothetical protein
MIATFDWLISIVLRVENSLKVIQQISVEEEYASFI